MVTQQLDRALESISYQDVELAGMVVADDDRIDGRYLEVHQGILSLLARQAPVAGDLRIVAALLHVLRCIERMGDQCVNIAKLVPLSGLRGAEGQGHPRRDRADGTARALAGRRGQGVVRDPQRRDGARPAAPGLRDQSPQPGDLQARRRGGGQPRDARVGDVHDPGRALPRADRRQHGRHRRAGGVRRHRAVQGVRRRIDPVREPHRRPERGIILGRCGAAQSKRQSRKRRKRSRRLRARPARRLFRRGPPVRSNETTPRSARRSRQP